MLALGGGFCSRAFAKEPTGDFAVFRQCPRAAAGVSLCLYSEMLSGEVSIGQHVVPINQDKQHPIIVQGGIRVNHATEEQTFVAALNGETLSRTPQKVPGGLSGLVRCSEITGGGTAERGLRLACEVTLATPNTAVSATTELARPANEITVSTAALESGEGTALGLPVRVHLESAFLGRECYVGSTARPVQLNLTVGKTSPQPPNKPISGKDGESELRDELEFIRFTNSTLVDNAFSAPDATGCGGTFSFLLDPIIDSKLGLPSRNGLNTAIANNTIDIAGAPGTIESER